MPAEQNLSPQQFTPQHRGEGQQSYVPRHARSFQYHPRHLGPHAMVDVDTGRRLTQEEAEEAQDNPYVYASARRLLL